MIDTSKVTRFEIIDHITCEECLGTGTVEDYNYSGQFKECRFCKGLGCRGRIVYVDDPDVKIEVLLQDDNKTLKVLISEQK